MKAIFQRIQKWRLSQLDESQPVNEEYINSTKVNPIKEPTMRAVINGKLVDLPNGATVEDLRTNFPEIGNDDVMEEGFGGTKPLKENEALKEGSKVWTVPKIVKG
ncbi:hypothetical protein [Coleofasciculus sp.]|uniref:hypothetical protein n=1 Tax=Coleofasciculus sp. TaxID=3100458 RepID=UPI0039FA8018